MSGSRRRGSAAAAAAAAAAAEEDALHPRRTAGLVGQDDAARTLEEAARSGRLHHAWLLTGPPGIGKATLAYRFARWLLAGMPEAPAGASMPPLHVPPTDTVFRRIAAGAHADLRALEPGAGDSGVKRLIRVEEVRAAIRFLSLTSAEGAWRVVVLDEAETMRTEAANAILKTLEEPPPRAVILLTAAAPDRLLPTIRSRCRRLELPPLTDAAMERFIAEALPDLPPAQRATLIRIAEGAPGRALALAEGEGLALQALVDEVLAALPRPDRRRWHDIAEAVASKRDGSAFVTFVALLRRAIAAAARDAARAGGATAAPGMPEWLGIRPLAEWSLLWDRLGRLAGETDGLNLDRKQAVLTGLGWLATPP